MGARLSLAMTGPGEKAVLQEIALANIARFAAGEPLEHVVSEERYRLMT
jgi:hypothetical protein